MEDTTKSVTQSQGELEEMRRRVTELEAAEKEHQQVRSALRASRQRFKELVHSIDGIVWEADARTFEFTFVSQRAERLLGYPVECWLDEPGFWQDHLHPEDQGWALDFCVRATAQKKNHEFEYRMIAADGRVVWLRDIVNVIVENGQVAQLRGVMVDITERKRVEDELAQHRHELEKLVQERTAELQKERDFIALVMEISPTGIVVVDRGRQIVFANTQAERVLGLTQAEITSRSYDAPAWRITDYEGNPLPKKELPFRRVIRAEKTVYGMRHAIHWPNGRRVLLLINGAPLFDESGQVDRVVFNIRDVTEQVQAEQAIKASERRLRDLYDNAPNVYLSVGMDGLIHRCNKKTQELLGYEIEKLVGQPILTLYADTQQGRAKAARIFERARAGEAVIGEELQMRRADNRMLWCNLTVEPVYGDGGEIVENRLAIVDITERKRAESARARELHSLEQLSGTPRAGITAASFGLAPLKSSSPDVFSGLVRRYKDLLDCALEEQVYRVEHDVSEELRNLAEYLGGLRSGPRDVVEIHITALKRKTAKASSLKAQAYVEEGRLIVLELMGYLTSYYRNHPGGGGRVSAQKRVQEEERTGG